MNVELLLNWAIRISLGCCVIGLALQGPRRWVKRLLLLPLALLVVETWSSAGAVSAAQVALVCVLPGVLAGAVAVVVWRAPIRLQYQPLDGQPWPAHAVAAVERWTAELELLGFRPLPDVFSVWKFGGDPRVTNTRFFRRGAESCWITIGAQENPRSFGRSMTTPLGDGFLTTADRQIDPSLFTDPAVFTQQVDANASCAELIQRHEGRLRGLPAPVAQVDDVVATAATLRNAWGARLVASGQGRATGEWLAIGLRAVPTVIARILGGWLR